MRSYRKSIWAGSFMSLMISASAGLFCSLILTALSALVIYFFLGDMRTVKYFSAGAIMVGDMSARSYAAGTGGAGALSRARSADL